MSRTIFFLALVALLAATTVQADIVTVTKVYLSSTNCTGTYTESNSTSTPKCVQQGDNTFTQTYYNDDATVAWTVQYANSASNCSSTDTAITVSRLYPNPTVTPTTCVNPPGTQYSYSSTTTVVAPNPAYPFGDDFPSGWAIAQQNFNTTTSQQSESCGTDGVYVGMKGAYRPGYCQNRAPTAGSYKTVNSGSAVYCSGSGAWAGQVIFTDAQCTSTNWATATFSTTGCRKGQSISCAGDEFSADSGFGFSTFDASDCSGSAYSMTYFQNDVCIDSVKWHCGGSGNITQAVSQSVYSDSTKAGLCPADQTPTTTVWAADGTCINKKTYSCDLNPPSGSGAATVSSSIVALVVAALVAIFGARL